MYCNKCGKHNPEDSKFCKYCGSKIINVVMENKTDNKSQIEVSSSEQENKKTIQNNEKVKAGLHGWLALAGLGLILSMFLTAYGLLPYFQYLNLKIDIPGYSTLLQFEFIAGITYVVISIYLIYLYFKKNIKFRKYYIVFLIATILYSILDYIFLASLTAPTPEQQKIINDALTNNSNVGRTIIFAIIWIAYMMKSKQVKATFVNNK